MPRFLMIIHSDEQNVPTEDPGLEFKERMGALNEEITKAGVMLDGAEFVPTSEGTLVTWSDGKISHTDGPFPREQRGCQRPHHHPGLVQGRGPLE
ncbi:YciI family protein [Streptomyces hawaiiensis]|uniref:YciI family protein n=1 Tax=Streptomyces hawaiiensis TaxID=67305 RepID=UPI0036692743